MCRRFQPCLLFLLLNLYNDNNYYELLSKFEINEAFVPKKGFQNII